MTSATCDALRAWLDLRAQAVATFETIARRDVAPVVEAPTIDGHRCFLDTVVRARDAARAERMLAALVQVRADARSPIALRFERLQRWHAIAVGAEPEELRQTDAFAKGGRERYGAFPDFAARFAAHLAEAEDAPRSLEVRAALAYLDVAFFHPFSDGNGRLAALALDFVLAREGVVLPKVGPLFVVARPAHELASLLTLVRLLQRLRGLVPRPSVAGEPCARVGLHRDLAMDVSRTPGRV